MVDPSGLRHGHSITRHSAKPNLLPLDVQALQLEKDSGNTAREGMGRGGKKAQQAYRGRGKDIAELTAANLTSRPTGSSPKSSS